MTSSVRRCSSLQARVQRDRLAQRPGGDLALGQLGHQPREALHPLAVEGRQQQLALAQVRALVEQDHRVRADHRFEDARALARMQHLRRRREDLLDLLGIGDDHERRLAEQADREARRRSGRGSAPGRRSDGSTSRSSAARSVSVGPGGSCVFMGDSSWRTRVPSVYACAARGKASAVPSTASETSSPTAGSRWPAARAMISGHVGSSSAIRAVAS